MGVEIWSAILTFLKCCNVSGLFSHISVINVTPVIRMPEQVKCNVQSLNNQTICEIITMILFAQQRSSGRQEDLHQVRHTFDDAERTKRCLFANIRIRRFHQTLHLAGQIACHFGRGNGSQCAQRKANNELRWTVQITENRQSILLILYYYY